MSDEGNVHVVPRHDSREHDSREHELSDECWCEPRIGDPINGLFVIVHHSEDRREFLIPEGSDELNWQVISENR